MQKMPDTRAMDYYGLGLLLNFLQRNLLVGQMTDPNHFGSVIFKIWSENGRWPAVISSSVCVYVCVCVCVSIVEPIQLLL